MIDYHIHTGYSFDVEKDAQLSDYCRIAKEKNISEIAAVNHFVIILTKPDYYMSIEQIPSYFEASKRAQEDFGLKIKVGLEVDYFQGKENETEKILDDHHFDIILGSVHRIDGILIDKPMLLQKYSQKDFYKKYFSTLRLAIESHLFDVMAHLDIVRRWGIPFYKKDLPFEDYKKEAEQVIEALVDNGVGIEINTSGFRNEGINDSYPSLDLLTLCKKYGVKIVTIGSDAHSPSQVGLNLENGIEKLRKVGYDKIYTFDKRKPHVVDFNLL